MIDAKTARKNSHKMLNIFNKFNVSEDEKQMFMTSIQDIKNGIESAILVGNTTTKVYSYFSQKRFAPIIPKIISYISSFGYKIKYECEPSKTPTWAYDGVATMTEYFFNICWNETNNTTNYCPCHCPFNSTKSSCTSTH